MNQEEIIYSLLGTSLLVFSLIVIMATTFVISAKRKYSQEAQLAETRLQFEQELRKTESEVSEQIMGRIAEELHDNIGQLNSGMLMMLKNLKIDFPEMESRFNELEICLNEADRQLRILSRTLNHDYLGKTGLLGSLDLEVERLRKLRRMEVSYTKQGGTSHLSKNQELVLFRIFQEITQNTLRHSRAERMELELDCRGESFVFKLSDNGKGFDVNKTLQDPNTNGLHNLFRRAEMAGLEILLQSTAGEGTRYAIKSKTV